MESLNNEVTSSVNIFIEKKNATSKMPHEANTRLKNAIEKNDMLEMRSSLIMIGNVMFFQYQYQ